MIDIPVRARDALKDGRYKKNYRFLVLNVSDESVTDYTIENDNLVKESVKFDERMCSTDDLKFGLCEGTNIEFQYFSTDSNTLPNITGRRIKAYCDCSYLDSNGAEQVEAIPMGYFTIDECSRQASTGIIKASGYNKLLSDYLDQDVTDEIQTIVSEGEDKVTGKASISHILETLLEGYSIEPEIKAEASTGYNIESVGVSAGLYSATVPSQNYKYMHMAYATIYFTIVDSTINDYYAFKVFSKNIRDKIKTWCPYLSTQVYTEKGLITCEEIIDSGWYPNGASSAQKTYVAHVRIISRTQNIIIYDVNLTGDNEEELDYATYISNYLHGPIQIDVPLYWFMDTNEEYETVTSTQETIVKSRADELVKSVTCVEVYKKVLSDIEKFKISTSEVSAITSGLTLRELQSATFELSAQYGKLDRVTDLFSGVTLNGSRLYPADTLYPADDLYPVSASERADKAMYQKLWADEGNIRKFRNLIVTYKDSTTNADATITTVVNTDGTDDYVMDDNWLFKNLSWTSTQISTYISTMVAAMQNVTWFPFQMWCAGLPYIETGDEIEVSVGGETYPTYVLTRTLSGIQNLQDTFANGTLNIF